MNERAITGKLLSALRDDGRFGSCAVEIKVARGRVLHKGALKDHQRRALMIAHERELYWKIADDTHGQKPFDGVVLKKVEAYLVIRFEIRPKAEIWALSIDTVPEGAVSIEFARERGMRITT